MYFIPIPSKWKKFSVETYLCKPIQLKYIHILLIIIITIIFTSFMIYFTSLSYNEITEVGITKHSIYDDGFTCTSIGSRSVDAFDFVAHTNNMSKKYQFIDYEPVPSIDTYSSLPGLNISNWRIQEPLYYSTNRGTMNYSVDKGNAETREKCNSNLFETLCNINGTKYNNINIYNSNNAIKVYFWYEIMFVINVSIYKEKLIWYYNNTEYINNGNEQFSLYYYHHDTKQTSRSIEFSTSYPPKIPGLYRDDDCIFIVPNGKLGESNIWYYALTNGGSMSSVWDLCQARFIDIGNISVYMGWVLSSYYDNKTVFKIDPMIKGMVECWYNDINHGLIKTDYYNSYGQNDIILTPSNKTGIMLEIANDLFDFQDSLTTISNGDVSYIRIDDDIITTEDALKIWQNNICIPLINGYCDWVDVPPYFCKKYVHKTLLESISLSLSPTSTAYSVLLISFLFIMKCKSYYTSKKYGDNLFENEMNYFPITNQTDDLVKM